MKELAETVREVAELFERMAIHYAVMGGLAVRVYGIPRATYDIDFTAAVPRDRLPDLYAAVTALGYTVPEPYTSGWVDEVGGMPLVKFRLYHGTHGIDIDVFLAESRFQNSLIARRRMAEVEGFTVWLVSPEDLILLKLIAGRPRDLADIGDVVFIQGHLDEAYLRHWAAMLGISDALQRILLEPPAS
jgi:hypothetical protein